MIMLKPYQFPHTAAMTHGKKYYLRMEDVDKKIIPVGCVLTMVGTGSEMNGGSVITNHALKTKNRSCVR